MILDPSSYIFTLDELIHMRRLARLGMKVKASDLDALAWSGKWSEGKHECGVEYFRKSSADIFARLKSIDPFTDKIERALKEKEAAWYASYALRYRRRAMIRFRTIADAYPVNVDLTNRNIRRAFHLRNAVDSVPSDMFPSVIQEWKERGLAEEIEPAKTRQPTREVAMLRFRYFGELELDAEGIERRLSAIQDELKELKERTGPRMVKLSDGSSWEEESWRSAKVLELERKVLKFEKEERVHEIGVITRRRKVSWGTKKKLREAQDK